MTLLDSIRICFTRYADFTGRAGRAEFWWFVLFNVLTGMVFSLGGNVADSLWTLVTLVPTLAVAARRLHDMGRSGWWQLIGLLPIIGWLVLLYFFVQPSKQLDTSAAYATA